MTCGHWMHIGKGHRWSFTWTNSSHQDSFFCSLTILGRAGTTKEPGNALDYWKQRKSHTFQSHVWITHITITHVRITHVQIIRLNHTHSNHTRSNHTHSNHTRSNHTRSNHTHSNIRLYAKFAIQGRCDVENQIKQTAMEVKVVRRSTNYTTSLTKHMRKLVLGDIMTS